MKTSYVHGGTAFKQVECSSSIEGFTSTVALNEPLVLSDDMPTPATYVSGNSNYSTPVNSPYQTTRIEDYDSAMGSDAASLWMSQNMVLDPSKVLMFFLFLSIGSCFFYELHNNILMAGYRNVLEEEVYLETISMCSQTRLYGSQVIIMTSNRVHLSRILVGKLNFLVISVAMVVYLPSQSMEATWSSMMTRIFHIKVITRTTYWSTQISADEHWDEIDWVVKMGFCEISLVYGHNKI